MLSLRSPDAEDPQDQRRIDKGVRRERMSGYRGNTGVGRPLRNHAGEPVHESMRVSAERGTVWTTACLCRSFVISPRVDDEGSTGLEVSRVPGHDPEAVTERGSGDQSIGDGYLLAPRLGSCGDLPPDATRFEIDFDNLSGVPCLKASKPDIQLLSFPTCRQERDPFLDLPHGDNAHVNIGLRNLTHCLNNGRIGIGQPQFTNDGGIQECRQSSTSRISDWSRSRSTPSKLGPLIR